MQRTNIKLGGQFKLDVYDASGNHLRSSDFIDNFITNTGVLYPYYFAFADCFRYLSLGHGTQLNSTGTDGSSGTANLPPTTGLDNPDSTYSYLGSGNYVTGGGLGGGCGNFADPNSNTISLVRQWGLPDSKGGTFLADITFSEFMVSPGAGRNMAWLRDGTTNYDPDIFPSGYYGCYQSGLCFCSDIGFSSSGLASDYSSSPDLHGLDCSQIAKYYSLLPQINEIVNNQGGGSSARDRISMCDASAAFARIVTGFSVLSGQILTVTYKLNISFDTGIKLRQFGPNAPYDPTDDNWLQVNANFNITNPGIKLIVDGFLRNTNRSILAPNGQVRLQHLDYTSYNSYGLSSLYGESFIPSVGMGFEPSCIYGENGNFVSYLSDDNTQFLVNKTGGACFTGTHKPWNTTGLDLPQNSGLLPFSTLISGNLSSGAAYNGDDANYWFKNPFNIRTPNSSTDYPSGANVADSNPNVEPQNFTGDFSNSLLFTGSRFGMIQTQYQFDAGLALSLANPDYLYVRSMVIGYRDAETLQINIPSNVISNLDSVNIVPFVDCLFSGTDLSAYFIPTIFTGNHSGTVHTTFTGQYDKTYNYLTGIAGVLYPRFTNQLTWTCDCPAGVDGCPAG